MKEVTIDLCAPLKPEIAASLRSGQRVLISGRILAARDAAHKRLYYALQNGEKLPCDLRNAIIYYVGPTPGQGDMPVGSAGPTTAGRMDIYTPALLEAGVLGMIGKGNRSQQVIEAISICGAVYFAATGGAGVLLAHCIKSYKLLAYPDLGTEALAELEIEHFPAIVAIDSFANNLYVSGPAAWASFETPRK